MNAGALIAVSTGVVIALAMVGVPTVIIARRMDRFSSRAWPAHATVTGMRRTLLVPGRGMTYYARVEFATPDRRPVSTEVRLYGPGTMPRLVPGGPPVRAGQWIWIDYDPADPGRAEARTAPPPGGPHSPDGAPSGPASGGRPASGTAVRVALIILGVLALFAVGFLVIILAVAAT